MFILVTKRVRANFRQRETRFARLIGMMKGGNTIFFHKFLYIIYSWREVLYKYDSCMSFVNFFYLPYRSKERSKERDRESSRDRERGDSRDRGRDLDRRSRDRDRYHDRDRGERDRDSNRSRNYDSRSHRRSRSRSRERSKDYDRHRWLLIHLWLFLVVRISVYWHTCFLLLDKCLHHGAL